MQILISKLFAAFYTRGGRSPLAKRDYSALVPDSVAFQPQLPRESPPSRRGGRMLTLLFEEVALYDLVH